MQSRSGMGIAAVCIVLLMCCEHAADARTAYRRRHSLPLPLQPLVAVHAIVHPIVTAPFRVAFQSVRSNREPIYDAQPIPAAYYTGRTERPRLPRGESADGYDFDDDDAPRTVGASEDFALKGGARPTVSGSRAVLRNGIAYAPANAPASIKNAIWAANTLRGKPYVWGGGHGSFNDRGYDCSGTVSFALHHAGALGTPAPASDLMRFGERGRGRWFTVYARHGHTFAVIAGLRLDTTDFYRGGNVGPGWHEDMRDTFGYVARHPAGL